MGSTAKTGQSGYSLVEVMVASLILGMTIAAIVSMLRIGNDIQRNSDYRRQALAIAESALESPLYHFYRYPVLTTAPIAPISRVIKVGPPSVSCLLQVTVSPEIPAFRLDFPYPYKIITAVVVWNDQGLAGGVSLRKTITELR
jgi:prepilin-type N-terminal cleavage/methylation domain-containing protein